MKKPFRWKDRMRSFVPAFNGLKYALINEHNLRVQLIAAAFVILLSALVKLDKTEWCLIIICIGAVMSAEIMNSAIEQLVDLVSPTVNPVAGKIKDLAAAAVLLLSITAFVIALIILGSALYQIYYHLR